jgi:hypothetical protein
MTATPSWLSTRLGCAARSMSCWHCARRPGRASIRSTGRLECPRRWWRLCARRGVAGSRSCCNHQMAGKSSRWWTAPVNLPRGGRRSATWPARDPTPACPSGRGVVRDRDAGRRVRHHNGVNAPSADRATCGRPPGSAGRTSGSLGDSPALRAAVALGAAHPARESVRTRRCGRTGGGGNRGDSRRGRGASTIPANNRPRTCIAAGTAAGSTARPGRTKARSCNPPSGGQAAHEDRRLAPRHCGAWLAESADAIVCDFAVAGHAIADTEPEPKAFAERVRRVLHHLPRAIELAGARRLCGAPET